MRNPLRRLGMRGLGRAAGVVAVTTNFAAAAVTPAMFGPVDTATNAARIYMASSITAWMGRIKGSEARVWVASHPSYTAFGPISVSVDGGAFSDKTTSGGYAVLFSGLSDGWHTVVFRAGAVFGRSVYLATSGTLLTVIGAAPEIEVPTARVTVGVTGDFTASSLVALSSPGNFVPAFGLSEAGGSLGGANGSLAFRGSPTRIYIASKSAYLAVSVDGAAPTYYANPNRAGVMVTCDGALHNYFAWCSGYNSSNGINVFGVGPNASASDLTAEKRLHHFGHSIVYGQSATSPAHTDMARTAARKGYQFSNFGVSGNTIQTLVARLDALFATVTVASTDVAVIDIGRNDDQAGFDAADTTDFASILNKVITKGYGKILVLAGLPDSSGYNPYGSGRQAEAMQSAVTATGNANVIYISRQSYSGVTFADGVHPTDAGYVTMDTLNVTAIDPSLP